MRTVAQHARDVGVPGNRQPGVRPGDPPPSSLVTDGVRASDGRVLVGVRLPRRHALYEPDAEGHHDPLLMAEAARQAMIHATYAFYGVPLGHHLIVRDLGFRIEVPELLRTGPAPLPVEVELRRTEQGGRPAGRTRARLDAVCRVAGRRCASMTLTCLAVGSRIYEALRTPARPAPVPRARRSDEPLPAAEVGRSRQDGVLLSPAGPDERRALLWPDPAHPAYVDSALDHVPVMVLAEAFRQAGYRELRRRGGEGSRPGLVALDISFTAFAELGDAVVLSAARTCAGTAGSGASVHVTAAQGGQVVAAGTGVYVTAPATGHPASAVRPRPTDVW